MATHGIAVILGGIPETPAAGDAAPGFAFAHADRGSARDRRGRTMIPSFWSGLMMLDHPGEAAARAKLVAAIERTRGGASRRVIGLLEASNR